MGKNSYVELEIKKAKTNGTGSKVAPQQKPCQKMTEAVVMDGGRRGELVKVCADRGTGQKELARRLSFIATMRPKNGKATAYICQDYVCNLPTNDPDVVARLLDNAPR